MNTYKKLSFEEKWGGVGGVISVWLSSKSSHETGLAGHPCNTSTCWIHFILHGVFICAYLFYDEVSNVKHVLYYM